MAKASAPVKLSKVYNATLPIAALKPHPRNPRQHPDEQISDLEASLERWSQVQSVVVHDQGDRTYHIIAGHGLIEAAQREGFAEIDARVMGADWPEEEAVGYLAADNKLREKGEDDLERLTELLQEQANAGYHLESLGSSQEELDALLEELTEAADKLPEPGDAESTTVAEKWAIVIECRDEQQQTELLDRFQEEGLSCRAIVL